MKKLRMRISRRTQIAVSLLLAAMMIWSGIALAAHPDSNEPKHDGQEPADLHYADDALADESEEAPEETPEKTPEDIPEAPPEGESEKDPDKEPEEDPEEDPDKEPEEDPEEEPEEESGPVRILETGESFLTLEAAVAEASTMGSAATIEVSGDVTVASDLIITTDVKIIGARGAHTIVLSRCYIKVQGGSLTLGGGTDANPLTISGALRVTAGTINIQSGISIINSSTYSTSYALHLNGPNVNCSISGGYIEGNVALNIERGAQISEISGGVFAGIQDVVHLSDAGSKIHRISGGEFYQTASSVSLHGHCVFVQNNSQIGEISGGYFEATLGCAMVMIRGGWVGQISGGIFAVTRVGSIGATDNRNAAIRIQSDGSSKTGIGTFSGGEVRGTNFGILSLVNGSQINYITGGEIKGTVALQNDFGSAIISITGGTFTGSQGLLNVGRIGEIGGNAVMTGSGTYGIFNYSGALIEEISGAKIISEKNSAIANGGTIKHISGGTIIGRYSAIDCDGINKGSVERITGGVFQGTVSQTIVLAKGYPLTLEPDLSAEKGFGRYNGKNGAIFNDDNRVIFPGEYRMSTRTEPVAGIEGIAFKYLTLFPEPDYTVTFDANGGSFDGDEPEAVTRLINPPDVTLGAANMPPDPARKGYSFLEWNTEIDGSGDVFTAVTAVAGDVTVYALWEALPPVIEVILPPEVESPPPEVESPPPEVESPPPPGVAPPVLVVCPPPSGKELPTLVVCPPPEEVTPPPVVTTTPPGNKTTPPEVIAPPPVVTVEPPDVTDETDESGETGETDETDDTAEPPEETAEPPEETAQPPENTSSPPDGNAEAPEGNSAPQIKRNLPLERRVPSHEWTAPYADRTALSAETPLSGYGETQDMADDDSLPLITIGETEIPLHGKFGSQSWALANLILCAAGAVLAVITIIRASKKKEQQRSDANGKHNRDTEKAHKKNSAIWGAMTLILGIVGIIVFILTEDTRKPMVLTDAWTIINAAIFIAEFVFSRI